jgi:hypothetical protein
VNEALKPLLADLRTAVATIEKLDLDSTPALVSARLILAVEKCRSDLLKAKDAAVAVQPDPKATGPLFKK